MCSPLSVWSRMSSSEDQNKCLIPNNEHSHVLSARTTFSYGLGSLEMLLAESNNLCCRSCVNSVESWYKLLVSVFAAVASNPARTALPKSKIPTLSPRGVCPECPVGL